MIYYLEDDEQIRNLTLYTLAQTGHETQGFPVPPNCTKLSSMRFPTCSFSM